MRVPRYRLTLEYQGTRYRGWQAQKNARSVQGALLQAAAEIYGSSVDIQGAGRTDAGVHALGQVAHLELPKSVREDSIVPDLNDRLPPDITVLGAARTTAKFHARHHAVSRSYLYQISRRRTALGKPFVWWVKDRLDAGRMARAAALLPGMHDFAAFADRRLEEGKSTLVLLEEAVLQEAGDLILLRFRASHFLWRMVRRMVGVLAQVGRGALPEEGMTGLLAGPSDYPAAFTAPPSGLFLEEVIYPGERYRRPLRPVLEVAGIEAGAVSTLVGG